MSYRSTTSDRIVSSIARTGYAARGIVYLLVGGLTLLAALGRGGQATGSRGALESVLTAPFGTVLLLLLTGGLVSYSVWRAIQAIRDPDRHGRSPRGIAIRLGLMASALSHLVLAAFSISLIVTLVPSGGGQEGSSQNAADWLMSQPFGRWLVGLAGLAVAGVGLAHHIKAWGADFDRILAMPDRHRHWAYPMFRFSLSVRGLVFIIIGTLFLLAAYRFNPEQAGGTTEALNTLREQPFGRWLLAVVAIGLFTFGVYSLLESAYRRLEPLRPIET